MEGLIFFKNDLDKTILNLINKNKTILIKKCLKNIIQKSLK